MPDQLPPDDRHNRRPNIACYTGDEYDFDSDEDGTDELGLDAEGRAIYERVKRELAAEEELEG